MRNAWRVLVFDLAAPAAPIVALLAVGVVLGWPLWWVSVCSVLCLLIVEAVAVNVVLMRRDSVTVGTDDDGPGLRLAVVSVAAGALVAAVIVGYTGWTVPERNLRAERGEVVEIATRAAEATATFTPQDPNSSVAKVAALMVPDRADAFKAGLAKAIQELTSKNISGQASMISAGLEAIGPNAASVAVILSATQGVVGQPPSNGVLALRVTLSKDGGDSGAWLVYDVTPIGAAPQTGDGPPQ